MSTEQLGLPGLQPDVPLTVSLVWNDRIFCTILPPRRKSHVIRTRQVHPDKRREYNLNGWPREHVLLYEHRLKLVGHEHVLLIITNASEAEHEHPNRIITPVRDYGTFHDARVFWQGRKDRAFVSVRLTHPRYHKYALDLHKAQLPAAPEPDLAKGVTQSGIVMTAGKLPAIMQPPELELANYLLAFKDSKARVVFSLDEIAKSLKVSRETVRRRKLALERKYPDLRRTFTAFRTRNAKGIPVSPLHDVEKPGVAPEDPE